MKLPLGDLLHVEFILIDDKMNDKMNDKIDDKIDDAAARRFIVCGNYFN
jgi:hypothetical protein